MKSLILAGGYATRLHPLTNHQPKHLLPIAGRPMLDYLIDKLENIEEIDEYCIVTNHTFFSQFEAWRQTQNTRSPITLINDHTHANDERLGSIGDIHFVLSHRSDIEDLCILGGDNLFEDDLSAVFANFHQHGNTIAIHDVHSLHDAKRYGNVIVDGSGKILDFVEKPANPTSTLCATLIWLIQYQHLDLVNHTLQGGKGDFAGDFIADLVQLHDVYGVTLRGEWFDIGCLEEYQRACEYYANKNSSET